MDRDRKRKKTFSEILWGNPDDFVPPAVDNERIMRIMKGGFIFGFTASDLFIFLAAFLTLVFLQLEPYIIPYLEGGLPIRVETEEVDLPTSPTRESAPPATGSPTLFQESTAAPQQQAIRIAWSFIGRHDIGDRYYLHTIVSSQNPSWTPETIAVLDPATGESSGSFPLNDRPDTNICPRLTWSSHVYWTEGIEPTELTPALRDAITLTHDPQTFRLTLRGPQGSRETIELEEQTSFCVSASE